MKPSNISPDDFRAWRRKMKWTRPFAAKKLGVGSTVVGYYETGYRTDLNKDVKVPLLVALGMAALENGIRPLGDYPKGK